MITTFDYCPSCTAPLKLQLIDGEEKPACTASNCEFVHWQNPTPVVAIIVEVEGGVVMAHNVQWPPGVYSVITGFLDTRESPIDCAIRETKEELGLELENASLVGCYGFPQQNQVILAYHGFGRGEIQLNHELDEYRIFAKDRIKVWPAATGLAVKDWLVSEGYEPEEMSRG